MSRDSNSKHLYLRFAIGIQVEQVALRLRVQWVLTHKYN